VTMAERSSQKTKRMCLLVTPQGGTGAFCGSTRSWCLPVSFTWLGLARGQAGHLVWGQRNGKNVYFKQAV
jgi:hypothetical protein